MVDITGLSYGAELELSDWPRREALAMGQGIDLKDVTMVNSNGVAVDPRGELYHLGGEIQTAPSHEVGGPADQLSVIMWKWPETRVNYRSNLHVHVRVPGLREHLPSLKRMQAYAHHWLPRVLPVIEPIPCPQIHETRDQEAYVGALRRYRRRKVSHQALMKSERLSRQLAAETVEEFHRLEVQDQKTGALHWAIHPRLCFNLRQLWETDTIEFRHFPGTIMPAQLLAATEWCRDFVLSAFADENPMMLARSYAPRLPRFQPYDHWLETGYALTSRKYHDAETIRTNIALWLEASERRRARA